MRIRYFKFFLLSILFSVYLPAFSQEDDTTADISEEDNDTISADTTSVPISTKPWPENIRKRLNSLLQNDMFRTSQLGLEVYDLTDDSLIYSSFNKSIYKTTPNFSTISICNQAPNCIFSGNIYIRYTQTLYCCISCISKETYIIFCC